MLWQEMKLTKRKHWNFICIPKQTFDQHFDFWSKVEWKVNFCNLTGSRFFGFWTHFFGFFGLAFLDFSAKIASIPEEIKITKNVVGFCLQIVIFANYAISDKIFDRFFRSNSRFIQRFLDFFFDTFELN